MKQSPKALETKLRGVFDTDFHVRHFKDNSFVSVVWQPSTGVNESANYYHDAPEETNITVFHNQPCSYEAWRVIFNCIYYYIEDCYSSMYLMSEHAWDGELSSLMCKHPDIMLQHDDMFDEWTSKKMNPETRGPSVFEGHHKEIPQEAAAESVASSYLYPQWTNIEGSYDEFAQWKQYILEA